jgi:hypothetical protein
MIRSFAVVVALGFMPMARADVESGPKAGEKASELKVFAVAGAIENKEVDYAKERGDAPTVYLFVNGEKFSRPINRFMKTLDGKLAGIDDKAAAVAVWLSADTDKTKEFLPKVQMSVKYDRTALTVFPGEVGGPKGWAMNTDAHLTVVVVNAGKVVKSFAYESVNETDVKAVEEELKKSLKK